MPTATLRNVGGSVVMAIPKRLLELVSLQAGSTVDIDVQQARLIIAPQKKKRYKLGDVTTEEREWLDAEAVGLEDGAKEH